MREALTGFPANREFAFLVLFGTLLLHAVSIYFFGRNLLPWARFGAPTTTGYNTRLRALAQLMP